MKKSLEFSKGTKIIEDGKVYIISKVELTKTKLGLEKILHYRPYFINKLNSTITCSMPHQDIILSNIRNPVSKDEIYNVIYYLSSPEDFNKMDLLEEAGNFKLNSILETTRILKLALVDQKSKGKEFDITKNGIIKDAVYLMLEEVALVFGITLQKALSKIEQASKTYYSTVVT